MNQVISILGLELPGLKARDVVMRSRRKPAPRILDHRDSLLILGNDNNSSKDRKAKDDDDTASTLSASDSDLSFSSTSDACVTFADPLVTEIWTRPYTTREEKSVMFYNEYDYLDFKIEAHGGKPRNRIVQFAFDVVSDVRTFPKCENPDDKYYTESELQGFLNEFIASLHNNSA